MALTGGHFPVELKFAGYDALIVEGKAEAPTYVWIKNFSATGEYEPVNKLGVEVQMTRCPKGF